LVCLFRKANTNLHFKTAQHKFARLYCCHLELGINDVLDAGHQGAVILRRRGRASVWCWPAFGSCKV